MRNALPQVGAHNETEAVTPAPPQLSLEGFVTYRLSKLQSKLNAQASAILRTYGGDLSLARWRILSLLAFHGETVAAQITADVGIDKGLFSRNVRLLVDAGLAQERTDKADHRRIVLSLTPQGEALYNRVLPIMRARQAHLMADFSPAERAFLFSAITRLEEASTKRRFDDVLEDAE